MSTRGDLLAEHTVLPGNAVDHLYAVVGEWQLLADLSFEAQELSEHVHTALAGGFSMWFEADAVGAVVLLRTLPLIVYGTPAGAAR